MHRFVRHRSFHFQKINFNVLMLAQIKVCICMFFTICVTYYENFLLFYVCQWSCDKYVNCH